jgi:hypothetical protein
MSEIKSTFGTRSRSTKQCDSLDSPKATKAPKATKGLPSHIEEKEVLKVVQPTTGATS